MTYLLCFKTIQFEINKLFILHLLQYIFSPIINLILLFTFSILHNHLFEH